MLRLFSENCLITQNDALHSRRSTDLTVCLYWWKYDVLKNCLCSRKIYLNKVSLRKKNYYINIKAQNIMLKTAIKKRNNTCFFFVAVLRIIFWALIFIFRLRFPPASSIATQNKNVFDINDNFRCSVMFWKISTKQVLPKQVQNFGGN